MDESWCEFFKEHHFYIGLSIDGPKHLHDHYRTGFDETYRAATLLRRYDVAFTPLTVINRVTAKHPVEIYRFLTEDLGCRGLQWLPCVGHKDFHKSAPGHWHPDRIPAIGTHGAKPGNGLVTEWSVDPDDWGEFLCQTFDLWRTKDFGRVYVHWFQSLLGQWMGKPSLRQGGRDSRDNGAAQLRGAFWRRLGICGNSAVFWNTTCVRRHTDRGAIAATRR